MNICVYGASSNKIDKEFILQGEALGEEIARRGHRLVYGGGANGLMGAVARGVYRGGGYIIGVAPTFFNVDGVLFDNCNEFIHTETMRERKKTMEDLSDAFIMTPGGIGTFEEFFEILTLKQLNRHQKAIVTFNTKGYYDSMNDFLKLSENYGFVTEHTLSLFQTVSTPKDALDYIESYKISEIDIKKVKDIN